MICERCEGRGYFPKIDKTLGAGHARLTPTEYACTRCGGTGVVIEDDLLKPKRVSIPSEIEEVGIRKVTERAFVDGGDLLYESPITIMRQMFDIETFDEVVKTIHNYGIHVDKDQLIKALQYDRDQYRKGFEGGRKTMAEALRVLDLGCKYCIHSCKASEGDCLQADYDCFVCTKVCPCRDCHNNSNWEFDDGRRWIT